MRLICTIVDDGLHHPLAFAYFLKNKGIDCSVEEVSAGYQIWIVEEDQVEEAIRLYREYQESPQDDRYKKSFTFSLKDKETVKQKKEYFKKNAFAPISTLILFITIVLFIWSNLGGNRPAPKLKGVIEAPIMAPIERALIYDYPEYFQVRDKLFTQWPPKAIENNEAPSSRALSTLRELKNKKVWMGIYSQILLHKTSNTPLQYEGPLFEKISQGQFWRMVTPAFLHYDILHIFFNLLWFIILANQIENRVGPFRILFFIVFTAIVSNTAQYFITGPFFMGLSGIICAMAAFIWARQQKAPWEGYLVHRFTLIFLGIFVIGMFLLSIVFFLLQFYNNSSLSLPIANTAHLSGALVGYLLGRTSLFASHL